MNPHKEAFAFDTDARTLTQALDGADVFIGISVPGVLTPEAVRSMADDPVVFALANPDPEIDYETAVRTREDIILATGRSDYPNQVNNVPGFPFIFRGALDVRAKAINQDMKIAAVHALAEFAREEVPDSVLRAYGVEEMAFDPNYIIPKPLDHRVLLRVAPAIARAAMETGAARVDIDLDEYREALERRLDRSREIMWTAINKARLGPRRIIFPEGDHAKILRACRIIVDEGIAKPILIGPEAQIRRRIQDHGLQPEEVVIEDPATSPHRGAYVRELFQLRHHKGITMREAEEMMANRNVYGAVIVHAGDADGLVSGVTQHYPDTIRPALQVIGTRDDVDRVCGLYIMIVKNSAYFFSDATVNIEPTPETLAEIALESARVAREFNFEPRVAMLSFSNFGSSRHALADRAQRAVEIVRQRDPDLQIDGEMQADTAVNPDIAAEDYPFSAVQGDANVLIFPDLQSGNIAYKLLRKLGGAEAIGPILMGMRKPVHVLPRGCDVDAIVNMAAIAVLDAQELERRARNA